MAQAKGDGTANYDIKRGCWFVRVTYVDPKTGETKRKKLKGAEEKSPTPKGKSISLKIGQKWLENLENGLLPDADTITLWEWLERWLNDYAKPKVRTKTFDKYESYMRLYIKPALGNVPLKRLTTPDIQRVLNRLLIDGGKERQPLSSGTVRSTRRYLIQALNQAVVDGLILKNVAKGTTPPKLVKKEIRPLTPEEAEKLVIAAKEAVGNLVVGKTVRQNEKINKEMTARIVRDAAYIAILLALATGMRLGEVFGLKWDCVDLEKGIVYVKRSLITNRKGMQFQEPKTPKSRRQIPLPADVAAELRKYKKRQNWHKHLLGDLWEEHDLVITGQFGRVLDTSHFTNRYFKPLLKTAGIPETVTYHDLRHTHATMLLLKGIPVKVVSERLGHSTIAMTLDTYSHVLPAMQDAAVKALEGVFTGKSSNL
ncbi:tyrosine-type recombinase/integrase [Sporolituus thermophilus]|uniref:Integrase n=1 Tax=Sporolituus thermophilus DSM 23256 TaxID=1123285 RepID=A0A1G7K3H1_9FIRM|nr:tyrosine-type recombinase/integrase [Sporolituus thermophilus]SDF31531.1 integrase [Sporolituus thermophilus DSM 23256]